LVQETQTRGCQLGCAGALLGFLLCAAVGLTLVCLGVVLPDEVHGPMKGIEYVLRVACVLGMAVAGTFLGAFAGFVFGLIMDRLQDRHGLP